MFSARTRKIKTWKKKNEYFCEKMFFVEFKAGAGSVVSAERKKISA